MDKNYIAYFRVSTRSQEDSGLGLESQKATVINFIKNNGNKIIGSFTEIESGRKTKRPELQKAIAMAKMMNATLVVAKLDRLSRNVHFISSLIESKVQFVCADLPELNTMTLYVLSAVAQYEAELISQRTRQALAAKRVREPQWKPGAPHLTLTAEIREMGQIAIKQNALENENNRKAFHYIRLLRLEKTPWKIVAEKLNAEGYKTTRGGRFHPMTALQLYKRFTKS